MKGIIYLEDGTIYKDVYKRQMVVFVSLIAIMGMTSAVELCIYLPHLLVVILCILVTARKWKIRQGGVL